MSESIYQNEGQPETLDRGKREETTVDIYKSSDSVRNQERQQALQHTGNVSVKNRRHRSVQVCLWVLCVLLLTAVMVLCVYFTTDRNRMSHELQAALEERDHLMNESTVLKGWFTEQDQRSDHFKWIYYNFSFYYFVSEWKTWSDSREACKQRGADLMIINSKEEQVIIQKITSSKFWIGLSTEEGVWKWVDGTAVTASYWMNGFPKYFSQSCAVTSSSSFSSGWSDCLCKDRYGGICEKRMFIQNGKF